MYFKDQEMEINRNNYETFFLLYLDRELNPSETQEVEKFLDENADLQKEFAWLQKTILVPAETIFEQKDLLLRQEEKRRIVPLYWMRAAAAIAVLILGSWLINLQLIKNHAGGIAKTHSLKNIAPAETNAAIPVKKSDQEVKTSPAHLTNPAVATNLSRDQKNLTAQNKSSRHSGTANAAMKTDDQTRGKNNQDLQQARTNPDHQNPSSTLVPDEPLTAVQKSSALELQPAENQTGPGAKQLSAKPGVQAPVLLLASAGTADHNLHENAVLKEPDYQTDNAISVVALNDNNKGITGFFKKLTKRAPADNNARKVRVSVFQFSY
jgi:hypothetical protein